MLLNKTKLFLVPCIFLAMVFRQDKPFYGKLARSAVAQTHSKVTYNPAYVRMGYPGGDVPASTGVCTDLVIRAYRSLGIDLQKEVHEDMTKYFKEYPAFWSLKAPDSNIDHRRVPNLMTFFKRKKADLALSKDPSDYKPGDLVTWNLGNKYSMNGITHIGIITEEKTPDEKGYKIAHNIGAGNQVEDMLFSYVIIGHYRYAL